MKIKKDWLKLEILGLLEYGIERDQLRLFNENCTDTYCICQFVKEYEKTSSLSLYFSNGENGTSHNEIFGTLQLLEVRLTNIAKNYGFGSYPALI